MKLQLYEMLQRGFEEKQARDKAHRLANPGGSWRGGNSGCITEDGTIIGSSPRGAVLRHLGIEMPTTLDDDLIFDAGLRNEDHWADLLKLANVPHLQEEECPIKWALPNGETITGRPDILLPDKFGIELKLISSNGKMQRHSHFGGANPIAYHVCQAAHYSHQAGIPWVLAYTSRAHYTAFYFGAGRWKYEHRSMLMGDNGKVINVKPFISMYDITWDGDNMLMDGKPTIITATGIERFYQYCSDCVRNKVIPEHGGEIDIWGKKEEKGSHHVTYDDFAEAPTNLGFDEWIVNCRDIMEGAMDGIL